MAPIVRNASAQGARVGVQGLTHVLIGILVVRGLGVQAFGTYAFFSSVIAVANVLSDAGLTLYISSEGARDRTRLAYYVNGLLLPAVIVGLILGIASYIVVARAMGDQVTNAAWCAGSAVAVAAVSNVIRGAVYAVERTDYEFVSAVLQESFLLAAVWSFVTFGYGLDAIFLAFAASRLLGGGTLLGLYHTRIRAIRCTVDLVVVRDVLRGARPYTANAIGTVVSLRADTLGTYWILGPVAAGIYEAAANLSYRLFVLIPRVLSTALLPSLIARRVAPRALSPFVGPTALLGCLFACPLLLFADPIFARAYSADERGGTLIRLMALSIPILFVNLFVATLLTVGGRQSERSRAVVAGAGVCVALVLGLGPGIGLNSGAIAVLFSQATIAAMLLVFLRRQAKASTLSSGDPHVALVVRHYGSPWNEGVRNLAREAAAFIAKRGSRVSVITSSAVARTSDPNIHQVTAGRIMFALAAGAAARKLGATSILFFSDHSLASALKVWIVQRVAGVQVVVYVPGVRHAHFGGQLLRKMATLVLPQGNVVYLVGSMYLKRFVPASAVIPPWTRLERPVPDRAAISRDSVVYLGTLERGRGVSILLDAIALVRENRPAVKLHIAWNGVGSAQKASTDQQIRRLGLQDAVHFIEVADRADAYELSDIVVIPHLTDEYMSFPLRILEAAQAGRPLVVTTACRMDLSAGDAAVAVKPNDAIALANAIRIVLSDHAEYEHLSRAGRKLYEEFHPDRLLADLLKWVQS